MESKNNHKKLKLGHNHLVSHDVEMILFGTLICLVAILGLIKETFFSGLINYVFAFLFGYLNYLIFLLLIASGLYMVIRKKVFKIKSPAILFGSITFIIALAGLISHILLKSQSIKFHNMFSLFFSYFPLFNQIPANYPPELGGGLLGYLFVTISETILGYQHRIGLIIIVLVISLIFALMPIWRVLFTSIRSYKQKRIKEQQFIEEVAQVKEEIVAPPFPRQTTSFVSQPKPKGLHRSFVTNKNPQSGLTKAIYAPKTNVNEQSLQPSVESSPLIKSEYVARPTPVIDVIETFPQPKLELFEEKRLPQSIISEDIDQVIPHVIKDYLAPNIDLLSDLNEDDYYLYNEEQSRARSKIINQLFIDFNVKAEVMGFQIGPAVTSFDIALERNTHVKQISSVLDQIAIRLGGKHAIFNEVVRGKTNPTLDIENEKISTVSFKQLMQLITYHPHYDQAIVLPFGKNIQGKMEILPIKDIIHMLVAGTTGSGKSVFIHTLIMTLIMRSSPDDVKILIIDPKRVELTRYEGLPHLLAPPIYENSVAKAALVLLIDEMENRYEQLRIAGASDIDQYNKLAPSRNQPHMPRIIVFIDEYADLAESSKGVNEYVERLTSKARAAGIHLVVATQRPTVAVITGNIKNNMTTKVALRMSSQIDSKTILDHAGAEYLFGNGDMIVSSLKLSRNGETRIQGAYVSDEDIMRVIEDIKSRYSSDYNPAFSELEDERDGFNYFESLEPRPDERYELVKRFVMSQETVSINKLMLRFKISHPRASNLVRLLQKEGVIGDSPESKQSNKGIIVLKHNEE